MKLHDILEALSDTHHEIEQGDAATSNVRTVVIDEEGNVHDIVEILPRFVAGEGMMVWIKVGEDTY